MMQEQLQSLMQSEMNIIAREIVKRKWNRQLRPQKPWDQQKDDITMRSTKSWRMLIAAIL